MNIFHYIPGYNSSFPFSRVLLLHTFLVMPFFAKFSESTLSCLMFESCSKKVIIYIIQS